MFWTTLVSVLVATASSGIALGAALGFTGLIILHFFNYGSAYLAVDTVWDIFNSFTLSAVPMFILLGEILLRSGLSEKAYAAFTPIFAKIPGGLLHSNVAVCTLFGAVSGSSLSTAAAVGSVAYLNWVNVATTKKRLLAVWRVLVLLACSFLRVYLY